MNTFLKYLVLIIVSSCANKNTTNGKIAPLHDTLVKDIPKNWSGEKLFTQMDTKLKMLGLEDLSKGFDGYEMRIWLFGDSESGRIIQFKNDKTKWEGVFTDFKMIYDYTSEKRKLISIERKVEQKKPKMPWGDFIDSMKQKGIEKLPDASFYDKEVYNRPFDAPFIGVEIASKNYYRVFEYTDITSNLKLEGPHIFHEFLKLIEDQFMYILPDKY